eukprot:gene20952-26871_t
MLAPDARMTLQTIAYGDPDDKVPMGPLVEDIFPDSELPRLPEILAAANGVIELAKERFTKNLWTDRDSGAKPQLVAVRDETDQARCIVERILDADQRGGDAAVDSDRVVFAAVDRHHLVSDAQADVVARDCRQHPRYPRRYRLRP